MDRNTPEGEAYWDGYDQAVRHEMCGDPPPECPTGYTDAQRDAWDRGCRDGYADT